MEYIWRFLLVQAVVIESIHSAQSPVCDVSVSEPPWQTEHLFVPELSTVHMKCTSDSVSKSSQWLVDLPNDSSDATFGFNLRERHFNAHGVYELPPIEEPGKPPTLGLLINDTARNNGTRVVCADESDSVEIKLLVFNLIPFTLEESGKDLNFINISWNQLLPDSLLADSEDSDLPKFSLQISNRSKSKVLIVNEPNYTFTAPKDAPPCEVYNFSVTATYVGATYTGAGCSVPSPVLSTMLPSLPDIKKIESSLSYAVALEKHNLEMITMTVSLLPSAHYCEDYPVQNYTLVAENPLSFQESFLVPNENSSIALPKNTFYRFKVVAKNVIGEVSTEYREIFTSDVQTVGAVESTEDKQFRVNCTFMTGSNALGCMVVLVSVYNNATVKLIRQNSSNNVEKSVIVTYPPSCYTKVFGYDIENNGDIGNLAVPGELNKIASNSNSIAECSPEVATAGVPRLLLIITGLGVLITLLIIVIILVLCVCVCRMKKSHRFKTDDLKRSSHPKLSSVSIQPVLSPDKCSKYSETPLPIYDLPTTLARNRMSSEMTESTDYSRTRHFSNKTSHSDVEDIDCQDYAQLQENFYHVLECGGTRYSPELSPADLNNFYDNPEVFTTLKSESTPDSTTQEIPVYQEITAYQQQRQGKSSKT